MSKWNFRLVVIDVDGNRGKFAGQDCHELKSLAGKLFHRDDVQLVRVTDRTGEIYLRLVKNEPEKYINVPSEFAPRMFA